VLLLAAIIASACMALLSAVFPFVPGEQRPFPEEAQAAAEPIPTFACPVSAPYSFVDTFGAPRSGGRTHQGTDLFGSKGSPVRSMTAGVVTKSVPLDDGSLGGARVWVRGVDGWWTYYAHLDSVAVAAGDDVDAGTVIGTMGNTGNAALTPTHLHLERRLGGMDGPVANPYSLLAALCPDSGPLPPGLSAPTAPAR
jgi:murein DD-endopeptidase MepM/ murein hydrolase activator NlpD